MPIRRKASRYPRQCRAILPLQPNLRHGLRSRLPPTPQPRQDGSHMAPALHLCVAVWHAAPPRNSMPWQSARRRSPIGSSVRLCLYQLGRHFEIGSIPCHDLAILDEVSCCKQVGVAAQGTIDLVAPDERREIENVGAATVRSLRPSNLPSCAVPPREFYRSGPMAHPYPEIPHSGSLSLLYFRSSEQLPHTRRRQPQAADCPSKRGQSARDGIGDRCGAGLYSAFAGALGAERISGSRCKLQELSLDIRKIGSCRQQIIHQRSREQLPVLVVLQMLQERAPQPLHNSPHRLAVCNQWIEDATDVFDSNIIEQQDLTRARVYRNVSGMRAVAERLGARVFKMARHVDGLIFLGCKVRQCRQGGARVCVAAAEAAVAELEGNVWLPEIVDRDRAQALQEGEGSGAHRVSGHHGRSAVPRSETFLQFVGRGADDADPVDRYLQLIGTDLGKHGFVPLTGTGCTDIDVQGAVKQKLDSRMFLQSASAAFNKRRKTDDVKPAADLAPLDGLLFAPADLPHGVIKTCAEMPGVECGGRLVGDQPTDVERHLCRRNKVAKSNRHWIDPEVGGRHVDQPLAKEVGLDTARPAIRPRGGLVRNVGIHPAGVARNPVRPREKLRAARRRGTAGPARVSADVDGNLRADTQNGAVAIAGNLEIAGRLPGVIRREKMLAPIFDPFDRTRQLSRNAGYEKIFRVKLAPNPETTSGIADLHHERALRKSEHCCERGPVEKRHLGDAEYGHALLRGIPIGN